MNAQKKILKLFAVTSARGKGIDTPTRVARSSIKTLFLKCRVNIIITIRDRLNVWSRGVRIIEANLAVFNGLRTENRLTLVCSINLGFVEQ